ncbi:hypothetical protein EON67_05520, partial [archaeon]
MASRLPPPLATDCIRGEVVQGGSVCVCVCVCVCIACIMFQACRPLMQPGGKFIFLSSGSATVDQV